MPEYTKTLIEETLKQHVQKIRPPEDTRDQLDIGYDLDGQTIMLMEIRPAWDDPEKITRYPYAKITYVKSRKVFKLYWFRSNGKWELYPLLPGGSDLQEILDEVEANSIGGFLS